MKWFSKWLRKFRPYRELVAVARKIYLPGFEGYSLYTVLSFFIKEMSSGEITLRASSIAFNFFLALFPAAIFVFTTIAYLPIQHLRTEILSFIAELLPQNAFEAIESTLLDILQTQHRGLLSFGFFSALFFSSNGVLSMIEAFKRHDGPGSERKTWQVRLFSIGLTIALTILLVIGVGLLIAGKWVGDILESKNVVNIELWYWLIELSRWLMLLLMLFSFFSLLFNFSLGKGLGSKFITPGSIVATVLLIATTLSFGYFVSAFNSYNKLYGSIGTLLVILVMIYFNSLCILIGFELNRSIERAKMRKTE